MNRFHRTLLLVALSLGVLAPASTNAQEPRDASRLFAREAPITTPSSYGLARLPLSAEVLRAVRPDFSDVRVFTADGVEQPYLIESGARNARNESYTVIPAHAERWIDEDDTVAFQFHETFEIVLPSTFPTPGSWQIALGAAAPSYVRRVVVTTTDDPPVELARTTVFRFVAPLRERSTFTLPAAAVEAAPNRTIRVEIAGEEGYLEPHFTAYAQFGPVAAEPLVVPLRIVDETHHDGRTTLTLERPPGLEPTALRITTSATHFARQAQAAEDGPNRGYREELGHALIYRAAELEGAESLVVPIHRTRESQLTVEIHDGDSPPLADLRVEALLDQPSLVFEASASQHTLRFGGGRARAPSYDLASLFSMVYDGDIGSLEEAELGEIRDNPGFDEGPALAFAMRPGRAIVPTSYRYLAEVTLPPSREGLSIVHLPAELLAVARPDLSDVRIVDADFRQWPYLLRPETELLEVPVTIGPATGDGDPSIYEITLPVPAATIRELSLGVADSFASREYTLRGMVDERWVELQEGTLYCDPQERSGCRHVAVLDDARVTALSLRVSDGDDAPLELREARIGIPRSALYVAAPEGAYRLYAGNPDATAPEYEIASAQRLVLAVPAVETEATAPSANPDHAEPAWYEGTAVGTYALWGVLVLAVLVLGLLTLRLSREAPAANGPPPGDAPPEPEPEDGSGEDGSGEEPSSEDAPPTEEPTGEDDQDGDESLDKEPVKF